MKVLLSIKPQFAAKIFDGTKKFEFRRSIFKRKGIKTIIVYASSPIKKVIGEFDIDKVLNEDLDVLWEKTKTRAGIDSSYYYDYFDSKTKGFAIKIKNVREYKTPLCLKSNFAVNPPQSFVYID